MPSIPPISHAFGPFRLLLLCALAAPAFGAIELTPDTFDKEVFESGKSAFVKFLAPW